jgi:hypothetical protein
MFGNFKTKRYIHSFAEESSLCCKQEDNGGNNPVAAISGTNKRIGTC